jgi:hemolysin activation/secretion protein
MVGLLKKMTLLGFIIFLTPGVANAIPFIPPTVLPERQTPFNPPANGGLPGAEPSVTERNKPIPGVSEAAMNVKFVLKKLVLEGNKTYTYAQLEPIFKKSIGKEISLADLQIIAREIEKYYVDNGYILTRVIVPPQEIDASGAVKLQIIEGYISDTVIDGNTKNIKKLINAYVAPVLQSKPLQITVLERAVLLINDIPGVTTKAVLTPSFDTPGATTLVLVVNQALFTGNATWDDRGTKYVGPDQFSTTLQINNVFQAPGQIEFDGKITANTNELRSGNWQYLAEVFDNGSTFLSAYTANQVAPGNTLSPLHITGYSDTASFIYTYPFIRTRRMNLSGTATYDYLNSKTYFSDILVTLDRIESIRFGGSFNAIDGMNGMNLVTGQYSQGIQLFSGDEQPEIKRSRVDGQKNYSKVLLTYTRLQSLPETWSLFFSTTGQLAFNSLLSAEQLGYGGAQYGSAYDSSEIISDTGIEGKLELRYNSPTAGEFFRTTQYYGSYDFGAMYDKHDIPGIGSKQSGTSAAAGIRLNIVGRVSSSFEIAKPLTKKVAAYDNKAARYFFSITVDLAH